MLHVHVATSARPDRVYATGVWQPYPIESNPRAVVRQTIESFTRWVRPQGPAIVPEMAPEEVAMTAQRVAEAMASGKSFRRTIDPRLLKAAKYILQGRPFTIRSAGRAVIVRARVPGTYNPMSYGIK